MCAAAAADVEVTWLEAALDGEFSLIRQRKADAGLGWLTGARPELAEPLDVMSLGEFEPVAWIPSGHRAARRGTITLDELTRMTVVHGPRRADTGTYDAWSEVVRGADPDFSFADPPLRHSLPLSVAFAATASHPAAVLTSPCIPVGGTAPTAGEPRAEDAYDMVEVTLERHPLVATAGLAWNTDLPRRLQQLLFDTAEGVDGIPSRRPASRLGHRVRPARIARRFGCIAGTSWTPGPVGRSARGEGRSPAGGSHLDCGSLDPGE
jgi:hypothetical protein